jgi:hypothetical protein
MLATYVPEGWAPVPHAIVRAPDLSPWAKLVYIVINSHIYAGHECVEITEGAIADEANCSWSQVHRGLLELEGDWLRIERREGRKSCYVISNIYRPTPVTQRGVIDLPLSAREVTPVRQIAHPLLPERGSGTNLSLVKRVTNNNKTGPPQPGGRGTKTNGITASKYLPGGKYHATFCHNEECIRKEHQP